MILFLRCTFISKHLLLRSKQQQSIRVFTVETGFFPLFFGELCKVVISSSFKLLLSNTQLSSWLVLLFLMSCQALHKISNYLLNNRSSHVRWHATKFLPPVQCLDHSPLLQLTLWHTCNQPQLIRGPMIFPLDRLQLDFVQLHPKPIDSGCQLFFKSYSASWLLKLFDGFTRWRTLCVYFSPFSRLRV